MISPPPARRDGWHLRGRRQAEARGGGRTVSWIRGRKTHTHRQVRYPLDTGLQVRHRFENQQRTDSLTAFSLGVRKTCGGTLRLPLARPRTCSNIPAVALSTSPPFCATLRGLSHAMIAPRLSLLVALLGTALASAADSPQPFNTEKDTSIPLMPAAEAAAKFKVPPRRSPQGTRAAEVSGRRTAPAIAIRRDRCVRSSAAAPRVRGNIRSPSSCLCDPGVRQVHAPARPAACAVPR